MAGRRSIGPALACALGTATCTVALPASATPSAKLTYLRGPGAERCPDEAELRKAVAARLGYDLFFPWASKTVVAEITKARKGFRGRVKIVDQDGLVRGERALDATSEDCGDVVRALALAISIAVDDLDLDTIPPATSPSPSPAIPVPVPPEPTMRDEPPAPGAATAPDRPAPAPAAAASRGRLSFEAWLTPLASVGVAPKTSLGILADVGARYGKVSFGAEVRGDLPASGGDAGSGQVRTFVLLGSVVPCFHAPAPLFVCAVLSAGTFQEEGTGVRAPRSGAAPFADAGARLGIEQTLSSFAFFLAHADGLATLTRHTVQIDGQQAFTLPAFSASVGFGAGVHFVEMDSPPSKQAPPVDADTAPVPTARPQGHAAAGGASAASLASFRELFDREISYVWSSLRRLGIHEKEREDLANEVFFRVYQRLHDYDPARPVRPWLFAFAVRVASEHRRRASHRFEQLGGGDDASLDAIAPAPPNADDTELVLAALSRLDMDKRAILVLHDLDGNSVPEIAIALDIPEGTAYSRLRAAREQITVALRRLRGAPRSTR